MVIYPTATLAPRGTAHRLDQFDGLVERLQGASFFDIGCNRGLYCIQAALAGAKQVDGCDAYALGIIAARQVMADFRISTRLEVTDLSLGASQLRDFGQNYDVILLSGVVHKLRRQMSKPGLRDLLGDIGRRVGGVLIWRGYDAEVEILNAVFSDLGLKLKSRSVSELMGPVATWGR